MAKNTQPVLKKCRSLGIEPGVMGIHKSSKRNPLNGKRKKSEYGQQLNEKQKLRFIYGVLEKQFHKYYIDATKKDGITGEMLLQILESRFDNVVFRLGLANTRREARQLVSHAHFTINGKKVNIPSYIVKVGDVIAVREKSRSSAKFAELMSQDVIVPKWLDMNKDTMEGRVVALADREDIDYPVEEHLVVEFYSR